MRQKKSNNRLAIHMAIALVAGLITGSLFLILRENLLAGAMPIFGQPLIKFYSKISVLKEQQMHLESSIF